MVMYDFSWNDQWTIDHKPRDRDKPFHRVNSPSYNETLEPPDGHGYDCGCRSPFFDYKPSVVEIFSALLLNLFGVIPVAIAKQLMRTAPGWVPVERRNFPPAIFHTFQNREKEVEGVHWEVFQRGLDKVAADVAVSAERLGVGLHECERRTGTWR